MITIEELNPHKYSTTPEQTVNLLKLLDIMNKVRAAYGKPMIVTSGLRSQADQDRINPSAPKSNHLLGLACDISDPVGDVWVWCMQNMKLMENLGIYFEDKNSTKTWVHFQIVPPRSGQRIFKP
jgi:uncharacterized protein YcbK (DUF882 family)